MGNRRSDVASSAVTEVDKRDAGRWSWPQTAASVYAWRHVVMTTWIPPETEDSPDVWDALSEETSRRWAKAHPCRAALAELFAYNRRKQGQEAGWPHLMEVVEREPFQARKACHRWLVYLSRLRAEGRDDFSDSLLDDLLNG